MARSVECDRLALAALRRREQGKREGGMTEKERPAEQGTRKPYISPPPSKGDVDQVSRDQALIADEWAPTPAPPAKPPST
jgi:hypothetical protein